jgi:hypothetical protein
MFLYLLECLFLYQQSIDDTKKKNLFFFLDILKEFLPLLHILVEFVNEFE